MTPLTAWPEGVGRNVLVHKLLLHHFWRNLFGTVGPRFLICETRGCRYYCRLQEGLGPGRSLIKYGQYEHFISKLVPRLLHSDSAVLDIGANIGYYSVLVTKYTHGAVYAFEPEPANYNILLNNLALNACTTVKPLQLAVGDRAGAIDFFLNPFNAGDHRCFAGDEGNREKITVAMKPVDEVLAGNPDQARIGLIKIDVQGFELMAVRGMVRTLESNPAVNVLTEFESASMREAGYAPAEYLAFWTERGFAFQIIDDRAGSMAPATPEQVLAAAEQVTTLNLLLTRGTPAA
jgi:FkbM family methyltransferase